MLITHRTNKDNKLNIVSVDRNCIIILNIPTCFDCKLRGFTMPP